MARAIKASRSRKKRQAVKNYPDPEGYADTPGWERKNEHTAVCDLCEEKGNQNDDNPLKVAPGCRKHICWRCENDPKLVKDGRNPVQEHEYQCHECVDWRKEYGNDEDFVRSHTGNNPIIARKAQEAKEADAGVSDGDGTDLDDPPRKSSTTRRKRSASTKANDPDETESDEPLAPPRKRQATEGRPDSCLEGGHPDVAGPLVERFPPQHPHGRQHSKLLPFGLETGPIAKDADATDAQLTRELSSEIGHTINCLQIRLASSTQGNNPISLTKEIEDCGVDLLNAAQKWTVKLRARDTVIQARNGGSIASGRQEQQQKQQQEPEPKIEQTQQKKSQQQKRQQQKHESVGGISTGVSPMPGYAPVANPQYHGNPMTPSFYQHPSSWSGIPHYGHASQQPLQYPYSATAPPHFPPQGQLHTPRYQFPPDYSFHTPGRTLPHPGYMPHNADPGVVHPQQRFPMQSGPTGRPRNSRPSSMASPAPVDRATVPQTPTINLPSWLPRNADERGGFLPQQRMMAPPRTQSRASNANVQPRVVRSQNDVKPTPVSITLNEEQGIGEPGETIEVVESDGEDKSAA